MTTALALEYIPRRMKDLGYGDNYYIRFIHLRLQPAEIRVLEASCEFFILVEELVNASVESDMGVFNTTLANVNEMQYEHQGQVIITNMVTTITSVHFIQVIPKHKN
jgi:hypothetical protein